MVNQERHIARSKSGTRISNVSKRRWESLRNYSTMWASFLLLHSRRTEFIQMSVLVEQQDETINAVEGQAETVVKDTEAGYVVSCRVCKRTETLAIQSGIY